MGDGPRRGNGRRHCVAVRLGRGREEARAPAGRAGSRTRAPGLCARPEALCARAPGALSERRAPPASWNARSELRARPRTLCARALRAFSKRRAPQACWNARSEPRARALRVRPRVPRRSAHARSGLLRTRAPGLAGLSRARARRLLTQVEAAEPGRCMRGASVHAFTPAALPFQPQRGGGARSRDRAERSSHSGDR